MASLIHRDEAVGIIAQRILGSEQKTTDIINALIGALWMDSSQDNKPSISAAIDVFGWQIVREVAITAMLHQIHVELAVGAGINPVDLDRQALAVITGAVQFGADPFAAMLANIGTAGLAGIGGNRYARVRHMAGLQDEEISFAERSEFGFDHATLGAAMLWEADLPDPICRAVLAHSNVTSPIWLAEQLSVEAGLDGGLKRDHRPNASTIFQRLGISEAKLKRIKDSMIISAGLPEFYFAAKVGALVA